MKKILIIENDPDAVNLIRGDLRDYIVSSADSGEPGLQLILLECPDLVLLELNLPVMNGIDVFRRIRKIDENLPIFIVSSRLDEIDRVSGLKLGADDYITKPFLIRELKAQVDSFSGVGVRIKRCFLIALFHREARSSFAEHLN